MLREALPRVASLAAVRQAGCERRLELDPALRGAQCARSRGRLRSRAHQATTRLEPTREFGRTGRGLRETVTKQRRTLVVPARERFRWPFSNPKSSGLSATNFRAFKRVGAASHDAPRRLPPGAGRLRGVMAENVSTASLTLNSGGRIPRVGLGVWQAGGGTKKAVLAALEAGYRHVAKGAAYWH